MFNLNLNEIDFLDTSLKEGGDNYNFYVEYTNAIEKDLRDGIDSEEFIEYLQEITNDIKKIKINFGGKIPYQLFCFLHHAPVLIRKEYFDTFVNTISNNADNSSRYFTEFHVKKSYKGPEADGVFNFRKELNYIRGYQSACRIFIKKALEEAPSYAKALYEDIVNSMTDAYKIYYAGLGYNFDNLHDGYLTPEETIAKYSSPDFIGFANSWTDEHPHLTEALTGLAAGYALTKILK